MSSYRDKPHVAPFAGPPWTVAAGWLLGALLAQATLAHIVALRGVVPSFVLVVVVWYAVRADALRAALYGLAAGLCEDALAGVSGGAWTISTTATAVVISLLSRGFFADSLPIVAAMTVIGTLVRTLLFWTTMSLQGYPGGLATAHVHQALIACALNAALMLSAMLVVRHVDLRKA